MAPAMSSGWATPTGAWAGWGARSSSNVQNRRSPWRITTCLGEVRSSVRSSPSGCGSKWKTDVGPQMEMSSLVLTIQLLGYLILTHTQVIAWWFQMILWKSQAYYFQLLMSGLFWMVNCITTCLGKESPGYYMVLHYEESMNIPIYGLWMVC